MNIDMTIRTPYYQMPITLAIQAMDRKVWRSQYCIECGRPFIDINDKFMMISDAAFPVQLARTSERIIEARCNSHACKQRYNLYL